VYWVLLEATTPVCGLGFVALPEDGAFGGFGFGVQFRADDQGPPFTCRYDDALDDVTQYSLSVLHFSVGADFPPYVDSSFLPLAGPVAMPGYFGVHDRFDGPNDVDSFAFQAELPASLLFTGQHAAMSVEVLAENGPSAPPLTTECGFTLEPTTCLDVYGDGPATLIVTLSQSTGAQQSELDAWRIGL
jgi:hypothetical protein